MRRIINNVQKNEPSLLEQLGLEYRKFRIQNPKRTARIPVQIKQKAREVLEGGATIKEIAQATGLTIPSISRWLEPAASKPTHKSRQTKKASQAEETEHGPEVTSAPIKSQNTGEWIKIRFDGREIEVARQDFWALLQAKP